MMGSPERPTFNTRRPLRRALTRRTFLQAGASGLTGAAAAILLGCGEEDRDTQAALEGPPEVTTLRLARSISACVAAQYVAESYLLREGFETVEYVPMATAMEMGPRTAAGDVDFAINFAPLIVTDLDQGEALSVLAGMHVGCFEVFASDRVKTISDLGGKAIAQPGQARAFWAATLAQSGIDVNRDVTLVPSTPMEAVARLASGEVDAYYALPPTTLDLRSRGIGHVILDGIKDYPWSQLFCCMLIANSEFVRRNPAATMHAVRAFARAAEHCAENPDEVAEFIVAQGHVKNPDHARQMMRNLPYDVWHRYEPADTLRFYALRLRQSGMVSKLPDRIISDGTDWTFLNRLKAEQKDLSFGPSLPGRGFSCELFPADDDTRLSQTVDGRESRRPLDGMAS